MRRRIIILLVALVACRERAPAPAPVQVADSAGIQVVTATGAVWGDRAAWSLTGRPTLTLGGVAGDSARDFLDIVGARRLADGSLVIANGATNELRWFTAEGKHLRTLGGKTPAAFHSLSSLFSVGDTLLVWDGRARSLTYLSATGSLFRIDTLRLADTTRMFALLGVFADGGALAVAGATLDVQDRPAGPVRPDRVLFLLHPGGGADSIGLLPGDELYLAIQKGKKALSAMPFGLGSRLSMLPDGFLTSEGDRRELKEYDTTGRLRRVLRWPGGRLPVTADDIGRRGRAMLAGAGTGMQRAHMDSVWRALPKPDSLPAVIGLVPDAMALVWAREGGHLSDETATWWTFAKDGSWLGAVALPPSSAPLDIGPDWMILHTIDENRIERVELRRLRR